MSDVNTASPVHPSTTEPDGPVTDVSKNNRPQIRPESLRSTSRRMNFARESFLRSHTGSIDTRLSEWLCRHSIDSTSRQIIFSEDFTYQDFVYDMDKSDLLRIGLK